MINKRILMLVAGVLAVQTTFAGIPSTATAGWRIRLPKAPSIRTPQVLRDIDRGQRQFFDRRVRDLPHVQRNMLRRPERSIRRYIHECDYYPKRCARADQKWAEANKRAQQNNGNVRPTPGYTAALRTACIDKDTGRHKDRWGEIYVTSKISLAHAEQDAIRQFRSRNICQDNGARYLKDSSSFEWLHK